jgi:capsular polysaccharide biosynthesis protein
MHNHFQTITFQYPKPENFDESDPQFDIFKKFSSEECFAPKIKILKNVRISSNSVVFNYFKIFRESCINEENYKKYSKGLRFFFKFIFPKINFSKKRFLLITDEWTSNYYHWHTYALKKLLILQEAGLDKDSILFLPRKYQKYAFVIPSLEKFGIKKSQIVFLRRKSNIKVAELAIVESPQIHPEIFRKMKKTLTKKVKTAPYFGERIYISREGQVLRVVENEMEMVQLLQKYGFRKVVADRFSYEEQITIFSKAKYLIGPHGAGFTNLLFVSDNSSILELVTKSVTTRITEYYGLATILGVKYFYQECEMSQTSIRKDLHHANLKVDLVQLEKNLKLMLKNDNS